MAQESRGTSADHPTPVERGGWSGFRSLVEEGERPALLRLLEGQSRVLEMIAEAELLPAVLDALTRVVEEQVDDTACSVLLLSADGKHLRHGAAPSLPERYRRAVEGSMI